MTVTLDSRWLKSYTPGSLIDSSCELVEKTAVEKQNIVDIVGDNAKYKQNA